MFALAQQVAQFVEDSISDPWTASFSFDDGMERPKVIQVVVGTSEEDRCDGPFVYLQKHFLCHCLSCSFHVVHHGFRTTQADEQFEHEFCQVVVAPPDDQEQLCTVYGSGDDIKGRISITVKEGRLLDHDGITIELIGRTEILENPEVTDFKNITNFVRLSRDAMPAGRLTAGVHDVEFAFENVVKEHESYYGRFAAIRYLIRMTASRGFKGDFIAEHDLVVQLIDDNLPPAESNPSVQMDVGVENCIHISFIYAHSHYPVDSILTGCILFHAVRLNIVSMETSILRIETVKPRDPHDPRLVHTQTIAKMECMDGTPARGDSIPVRWPLNGLGLGPSRNHARVSVRYQIRLSLLDEKGRQFYKTCDISLYRLRLAGDNPSWFHAESMPAWKDYDVRARWQQPRDSPFAVRSRFNT